MIDAPILGTPPAEKTAPATLPLEEKQRIALRVKAMLRATPLPSPRKRIGQRIYSRAPSRER